MPNTTRKGSNFKYRLPDRQFEALEEIALKKDQSIHELVWQAIDEYIEREKACGTK
jgi:predicted transcriptional regulator